MKKDFFKFPKQWKLSNLSEICDINRTTLNPEKTYHDTEFSYIDIDSIENETGRIKNTKKYKRYDAPSRARRMVKFNDVIMSTVRPYLKAFAIIQKEHENHICSTGFAVLSPHKDVNSKYLLYSIFSRYVIYQCKKMMVGAQYPALNESQVKKIKIPLPPLPEQKKIAEILSTVDQSLEKTTKVLEQAEKLKKALVLTFFKKGINHKKFKMSELGDIPNEWEIVKFSDVIDVIKRGPFGGSIKKEIFVNDGYKVYEQKNVIGNNFSLGNYYIDENKYGELKAFSIRNNDLLLTAAGTIGKVALVPSNIRPGIINQALIKITPNNKKIIPRYMYELLLTDSFKNKISGRSHGATMKNISSVKEIKSIKMPLPPIIEQKKIVEILETVNQKVLILKNRSERMTKLKKSLMNDLLTGQKRVRLES